MTFTSNDKHSTNKPMAVARAIAIESVISRLRSEHRFYRRTREAAKKFQPRKPSFFGHCILADELRDKDD